MFMLDQEVKGTEILPLGSSLYYYLFFGGGAESL